MLIPSILPDELAHGYEGRIQKANMYASSANTASIITRTYLKENEHDGVAIRAVALARASGMSLERFCQYHTLMPFLRAATKAHPNITHGSYDRPLLIRSSGLRLSIRQHMACADCIEEDINYRGFAYWRRRHQILGVPWCDKHLTPLFDTGAAFNDSPSAKPVFQQAESIKSFDQLLSNPIINRYIEVVSGFLERNRPLSSTEASMKLSQRAQKQGIRVARKGQRPNLSDTALNNLPISWLSSIFPGIELKKTGAYFSVLDKVAYHAGASQAYALALALLFDSAEVALEYWNSPLLNAPERVDREALYGQNFWNRSGLPSLDTIDFETTGRALLAFYNGYPLSEACVMHGANYTNCEELIRQAGARFAEALRRIMRVPVSSRYAPTGLAEQDVETSQPNKMADHIIKTWSPLETAA